MKKKSPLTEIRQAEKLFARWLDPKSAYFQLIIADVVLPVDKASTSLIRISKALKPIKDLIIKLIGNKDCRREKDKLLSLYTCVITSIPEFIHKLKEAGIGSPKLLKLDKKDIFRTILHRYTGLFNTLFTLQMDAREHTFAVANRLVEFCFGHTTFPQFKKIMLEESTQPIGNLFYAGMWQQLAGCGWKYWHQEALTSLRQAYEQGKTVVYIAGGSDVYQLIANGIYNITVIDPQLNGAQDDYYADDWTWLLQGHGPNDGIGDELLFHVNGKKIVAKRLRVDKGKRFGVHLEAGTKILPQASTVEWGIFEDSQRRGTLTFERRLATQEDFTTSQQIAPLMSFNELYFIAAPSTYDGWPIDPCNFSDDLVMYVKQLRNPVTKEMINNIAWIEQERLAFLRLGTSVK